MKVIKKNVANLLFITLGAGAVISVLIGLIGPVQLPPAPAIQLILGVGLVGVFLHRWVSGSRGEPLTSLPRVGNYQVRHALFYEGNQEKGEEPHYEFIVLIDGKRRYLKLPEKAVREQITGRAVEPNTLVHQLIVGEPEYVLKTEEVSSYSLVGRR